MEVEADLADGRHLRAPRERFEGRAIAGWIEILRLVRVDADGGEDALAGSGEFGGGGRIRQSRAGHQEPGHAGRAGAREELVRAVPHLQVTVGIGEQLT